MSKISFFLRFKGKNSQGRQSFLRTLLLIMVLFSAGALFWHNSKSQISSIVQKEISRIDYTGTLSPEQEKSLNLYKEAFFKEYGIRLIIKVLDEYKEKENFISSKEAYLFILIFPWENKLELHMAPLVKIALGEDFTTKLGEEYILPALPHWPEGLERALNALSQKMDEVMQGKDGENEESSEKDEKDENDKKDKSDKNYHDEKDGKDDEEQ